MTTGTVHLWTVSLDAGPDSVCLLLNTLSGDERVRAARLRTTELRLRFIVAHGALRRILSQYVGMAPEQIRLEATALGKPSIVGSPLTFNLSHSDGLAVCAVTAQGQVGVDVERVRPVTDATNIVRRYFAPNEVLKYESLPASERSAAFFSIWTRKEAFLKATGLGLQRGLDSFEVDITPAESSPRLVLTTPGPPDEPAFHLRSFRLRPHYIGALALDREIEMLEFFDWTLETSAYPVARVVREMRIV